MNGKEGKSLPPLGPEDDINLTIDEYVELYTEFRGVLHNKEKEYPTEIEPTPIKESVELEKKYAYDACPEGMLGISPKQFADYVEYIADRRLERIGLPKQYNKENPFPWMSQSTDLNKEKNFFETRVTEYQTAGSLDWE